jgi:hypothetical protein
LLLTLRVLQTAKPADAGAARHGMCMHCVWHFDIIFHKPHIFFYGFPDAPLLGYTRDRKELPTLALFAYGPSPGGDEMHRRQMCYAAAPGHP